MARLFIYLLGGGWVREWGSGVERVLFLTSIFFCSLEICEGHGRERSRTPALSKHIRIVILLRDVKERRFCPSCISWIYASAQPCCHPMLQRLERFFRDCWKNEGCPQDCDYS